MYCARPLCLGPSLLSEHYELRGIICSRRVGVQRLVVLPDTDVAALTGCSRAAWKSGERSFEDTINMQKLASPTDGAAARSDIPNEYWGVVYRNADRARRRFVRSE